jgi:hypothetical protein
MGMAMVVLWKQEPCKKSLARFFLTAAVLFPDGSVGWCNDF